MKWIPFEAVWVIPRKTRDGKHVFNHEVLCDIYLHNSPVETLLENACIFDRVTNVKGAKILRSIIYNMSSLTSLHPWTVELHHIISEFSY